MAEGESVEETQTWTSKGGIIFRDSSNSFEEVKNGCPDETSTGSQNSISDESGIDLAYEYQSSFLRKVHAENMMKLNKQKVAKVMPTPNSDSDPHIPVSDGSSAGSSLPTTPKPKSRNRPSKSPNEMAPQTVVSKYHSLPAATSGSKELLSFAHLGDQVHRRTMKQVFEFNIMVVGESGLGKSTLLNTLFLTELYKDRDVPDIQENTPKTAQIEVRQVNMTEKGVKLRINIIDTPGFADPVNGDECLRSIVEYVDHQMDQYFHAETGFHRKRIQDTRVHCCLYFISPYGHGLKPLDIDMMKRLHNKVNIIPVIAKADTLTSTELKKLKQTVLQDIEAHDIQIYGFPDYDSDAEEETIEEDLDLRSTVPFAVIGCNDVVEIDGQSIRSRTYPWGIVEVDNPKHCDFTKLKKTISLHMQDLRTTTSEILYENYREEIMSSEEYLVSLKTVKSSKMESMLYQKDDEIRRLQSILANIQTQMSGDIQNKSPSHTD
ncbi:hypothetical protein ScPMuIL_006695 [Solemya velum]